MTQRNKVTDKKRLTQKTQTDKNKLWTDKNKKLRKGRTHTYNSCKCMLYS